jgi:hypothetical protein
MKKTHVYTTLLNIFTLILYFFWVCSCPFTGSYFSFAIKRYLYRLVLNKEVKLLHLGIYIQDTKFQFVRNKYILQAWTLSTRFLLLKDILHKSKNINIYIMLIYTIYNIYHVNIYTMLKYVAMVIDFDQSHQSSSGPIGERLSSCI